MAQDDFDTVGNVKGSPRLSRIPVLKREKTPNTQLDNEVWRNRNISAGIRDVHNELHGAVALSIEQPLAFVFGMVTGVIAELAARYQVSRQLLRH